MPRSSTEFACSSHVFRAALLAAALLPALAPAAPLTLEQALELAVQRSEAARSSRAGVLERHRSRPRSRPVARSDAARRHRQPAGDRRRPLQHDARLDDDEAHRHRAGVGLGRQARGAPGGGRRDGRPRGHFGAGHCDAEARLQTALAYLDAYYAGETLRIITLIGTPRARGTGGRDARGCPSTAGNSQEVLAHDQRARGRARTSRPRCGSSRAPHASRWNAGWACPPTTWRPRPRAPTAGEAPYRGRTTRWCWLHNATSTWRGATPPSPRPTAIRTGPGRSPMASAPATRTW